MDMDVWRIECPGGTVGDTTVFCNGVRLSSVRAVSVRIEGDDLVTATLTVENVEVAIGVWQEATR